MKLLTKIQNDVMSQMVADEHTFKAFTPTLQNKFLKVGLSSILAMTAFFSSGFAQAGGINNPMLGMLGVSAVGGFASNGSRPNDVPIECNAQGTNGWVVAGSTAAGSLVGNQFGRGNGNIITTIAGGLLGGGIGYEQQQQRIRETCARQIALMRAQQYQPTVPTYNNSQREPNGIILYMGKNAQHQNFYVTLANSPAIAALKGVHDGVKDPRTDADVEASIEKSIAGLQNAYAQYEQASQEYAQIGQSSLQQVSAARKTARYAQSYLDEKIAERNVVSSQRDLDKAITRWQEAGQHYAQERAYTAAMLDDVVLDQYSIADRAPQVLNLFTPPPSAQVACQCVLKNVYSNVPDKLTIDRN